MYMLSHHLPRLQLQTIAELFEADPRRFERMSVRLGTLLFDYSKNCLDELAMSALVRVAEDMDIENRRDEMFTGNRVNKSEDRAVLHTALRQQTRVSLFL